MSINPASDPGEELTDLVENALHRRATGYEDAMGKPVPPDVRAAIYWLENRRPEKWKRKTGDSETGRIILNEDESRI